MYASLAFIRLLPSPHLTSPLRFERRTAAISCRRAFRASLDDGGGYIVPPIDLNPRTGTVCSACINSIVVQVKSSILPLGISIRAHPYLHVLQCVGAISFSFSGIALQFPRARYPNIRSVNHTVILTMAYASSHPVSLNVSPSIFQCGPFAHSRPCTGTQRPYFSACIFYVNNW